jgi:hypothetical protein
MLHPVATATVEVLTHFCRRGLMPERQAIRFADGGLPYSHRSYYVSKAVPACQS